MISINAIYFELGEYMIKRSHTSTTEFLLDNEFFSEIHLKLREVMAAPADSNSLVRIAMWCAELTTTLPKIEGYEECLLRDALYDVKTKGHQVQVILWEGSTIKISTGYKERKKALEFKRWCDAHDIKVYLESYKSVLGPTFGQAVGTLVHKGLSCVPGIDQRVASCASLGAFLFASTTNKFGYGASTHQKIVVFVINGSYTAIVGGFNLGSEYSCKPNHSITNEYWHDTAIVLNGDAAIDINNEWVRRWNKQQGMGIQPVNHLVGQRGGIIPVTIATTNSECTPRENDIRSEMIRLISTARSSIYIENYAFTDPALVEALELRLARGNIHCVVMINHPKSELFEANTTWSYFQAEVFRRLSAANGGNSVMYAASTNHTRTSSSGITYKCWPYPHSKLAIFDDRYLVIGSANWTYRSMEYDGEISAIVDHSTTVSAISRRLLRHWSLNANMETVAGWVTNALQSLPAPPARNYGIHRLEANDFTDWEKLSYAKRAFLSSAWQMF
jgi:phosphatidylserine/phosphatidylglycerophosphate/cardiolipin synthase-like enzyme